MRCGDQPTAAITGKVDEADASYMNGLTELLLYHNKMGAFNACPQGGPLSLVLASGRETELSPLAKVAIFVEDVHADLLAD